VSDALPLLGSDKLKVG